MAQTSISVLEMPSNDNSLSTKEFLQNEKNCEIFVKDSDEEIKMILNEIKQLTGGNNNNLISCDVDDVGMILKRAEDIALETKNLLKNTPVASSFNVLPEGSSTNNIPEIKVTKPSDVESKVVHKTPPHKGHQPLIKQNMKDNNTRRKLKARPYSAGLIESKKRESEKVAGLVNNSPKRALHCEHEPMLEELKDTNERVKNLELINVQLTDDNKVLRRQLEKVNEEKHVAELKLVECEKFINRLSKEYENRIVELKAIKQNESKIKADLQKERNERKNLALQRDKDSVTTHDLQRQVKEMEMILRRKHPDSVSALIVAAKSSTVEDNKKKLLEDRIARLERELKDKETHFQGILLTLQEKFGDMKQKYENHIIDVERQLMEDRKVNTELKNKLTKANLVDSCSQTVPRCHHSVSTQTVIKPDRASSAVSRLTQNSALFINRLKEDSYLVATIKGLQTELTVKQRTIAKINRETEELRKNLRNLQKEKEVLLHLNPQKKTGFKQSTKSTENILFKVTTEMENELSENKKHQEVLIQERNSLLDTLKRTNEEFILLKKKRIQDLHTLQLAHEKELMQMNMQVYPLQEEIKLMNRTVEILQERLRAAEDKLVSYQAGARDVDIHAGGDNPTNFRNKKLHANSTQ